MLSIIIPVLNEAENIVSVLSYLTENASVDLINELVIVDGGSKDDTVNLVTTFSKNTKFNILVVPSPKGRAKQMNTGFENATGDILYFLHADSYPPKHFDKLIINEVKNGNPAGCFKMKFDSNHWWLKLASWFTKFSWRSCRGGDQSQFITRELFAEIGGFDESYIIYEDNILINELYKRRKFIVDSSESESNDSSNSDSDSSDSDSDSDVAISIIGKNNRIQQKTKIKTKIQTKSKQKNPIATSIDKKIEKSAMNFNWFKKSQRPTNGRP